jgi:ABC-2 type transport system permease protein
MKVLAIMLKDLQHAFRSVFGLMFMFGIPLLLTAVFYFAFNGMDSEPSSGPAQPVRMVLVNQDAGEMGRQLTTLLKDSSMAQTLVVNEEQDVTAAQLQLSDRKTDSVLVLSKDFSTGYLNPGEQGTLQLYFKQSGDVPSIIVQNVLASMLDTLQVQTIMAREIGSGSIPVEAIPALSEPLFSDPLVTLVGSKPSSDAEPVVSVVMQIIPNIMGGMMIFFAFFSGAFGAQSILIEEAAGTLQRLFTTGSSRQTILAGKFLAVWLTVVAQVGALLAVSNWIFGIQWGSVWGQLALSLGIGTAAAGFGIFILSFLRSARSAGMVFSGAIMVTGFIGINAVFGGSGKITTSALFVPQGWAMKGLFALQSADAAAWASAAGVLMIWGLALFLLGKIRFDKRYQREA